MRCKQGDIAKVTGGNLAGNSPNIGRLVVVGERFQLRPLPLPAWHVYSLSGPLRCTNALGESCLRPKGVCPDDWLTPQNPPPLLEETNTAAQDARELVE